MELGLSDINTYLEMTRKRGAMLVKYLNKLYPSFNAIFETEIGRELLLADVIRMEELLEKICEEKDTEIDRREFKHLKNQVGIRSEKVKAYLEGIGEIKKVLDNVR